MSNPNTINLLLNKIESFRPKNADWIELDKLIVELINTGSPEKGIVQMLRVFERFPEEDGCGVFWTILHAIEFIDNYNSLLLDSLERQPSEFGIILLKRLLNSGVKHINKIETDIFYKELSNHPKMTDSLRSLLAE
jgi:hypothetical protein